MTGVQHNLPFPYRSYTYRVITNYASDYINLLLIKGKERKNYTPTFIKCTLVQALKLCTGRTTHRGSRGIALLFLDQGTRRRWGVGVTPRPLFTPGNARYLLYRRLGEHQGPSEQVRKISPPPGFDPRTVQPVASCYTDYAARPTVPS